MMKQGGIMQTVPEEMNSPRDGVSANEEELQEDDDDLSRAGISTRGMNRGMKKDAEFNEDLDTTQVPQVSILDTDGKNMNLNEDSEEAQDDKLSVQNLQVPPGHEGETRPASKDSHEARIDAMLEQAEDQD